MTRPAWLKIWMLEMAVVAVVLSVVAYLGGRTVDWVGSAAVLLTFGHAQVADRLHERAQVAPEVAIHCMPWLRRYFYGKELLWCIYFVWQGSWPALAGVGVFLLYPVWRSWWGFWKRASYINPDLDDVGKHRGPWA